jgi:hypothetical protein
MPFTLSHAAAAWPFRRSRLEFSALLTGCFVPDAPYFLFLIPHGFHGHTLRGMFEFDLPVGLVALWVFHAFVKRPASLLLPAGFRRRLNSDGDSFSFWPPSHFALIVLSILVGTATHLFWDSFTHQSRWGYRHWSFLRIGVHLPVLGNTQMYKLFQYGSSVFGLIFLAIWIAHWYRATKPIEQTEAEPFTPLQRRLLVLAMPFFAICGGILRAYEIMRLPSNLTPTVHFTADAVVTAITLFGIELLLCGLILRWLDVRSRRYTPTTVV